MSARSKARKRALDTLYEADVRGISPIDVYTLGVERRASEGQAPANDYVGELVRGVVENQVRIDELITAYSQGWTLDRMPAVDRCILRLGCYEILWRDDIPDAVAISEAVALAQSLSTDDSSGFVNGLLGRILEVKPSLVTEPSP